MVDYGHAAAVRLLHARGDVDITVIMLRVVMGGWIHCYGGW